MHLSHRRVASILAAAALLAVTAAPVAASEPPATPSAEPEVDSVQVLKSDEFGSVTAVRYRVQPLSLSAAGSAASIDAITPLATKCWTITWSVVGKDVFGLVIWQYNHKTDWCSADGKTVQSTPAVIRWPSNMAPGWGYTAVGGIQKWWGTGHKTYRSWSQGDMALCVPVLGCQHYYPWVDQTVKFDGTVSGDVGA